MNLSRLFSLAALVAISSNLSHAVLVGDFENSFSTNGFAWQVAEGSYTQFDSFFVTRGATSIELWTGRDPNDPQDADFADDLALAAADFPTGSFAGSAIFSDFSFARQATFSFDYQFDTFETQAGVTGGWNDYGFISIVDLDTLSPIVFDIFVDAEDVYAGGGQGTYSRSIASGDYRIGIGSMNRIDYQVDSILAIDNANVPDTGSALALLSFALFGLGAWHRFSRPRSAS